MPEKGKLELQQQEFNKVEDILKIIGGYGKYQKWLSFAMIFPQFPTAMIVLSPVFTGSNKVQQFCNSENYYLEEYGQSCNVNCSSTPAENFVFTSIVQEWGLICSRGWIVDTITSCQMAGMMMGACLSSILSDTFGRRFCFIFQTLMMGVLGMLPAVAFDPYSYAVTRFLAGFGVGACFVVYLAHLMEFLTASWRTICGTFSFWPLGEMLLALLAYTIGSWRWLTVATAIPPFLILPFHRTILESPRWLLIRKKTKEAHQVFSTIAEWNSCPPPDISAVEQLQSAILKEEAASLHGIKAVKMILTNRNLRTHMAIQLLCNATCSIVYYGVAFNAKNLSGSPYMNMLYFGIFDLFASPAAVLFNNWIGRRRTFVMYMALGTAFIISIVVLEYTVGVTNSSPTLVTILSLCGRFGIVAAWGALTCIILETSPTNLRSTCLGFAAFTGYFAGILSPQLALLGTYSAALPYLILCVLTVSSSISSWFLNETLQKPLQDVVD